MTNSTHCANGNFQRHVRCGLLQEKHAIRDSYLCKFDLLSKWEKKSKIYWKIGQRRILLTKRLNWREAMIDL